MTGPSAIGSEKGTPTSITSAPARSRARMMFADRAREYFQRRTGGNSTPAAGAPPPVWCPHVDLMASSYRQRNYAWSPDDLRNLQLRDTHATKIPRALRFNDRASMRASVELREPFLDHRLFELAMRQPVSRKADALGGKLLLRKIARTFVPAGVSEAPKRPLQTPQREWLQRARRAAYGRAFSWRWSKCWPSS